MTVTPAGQDGGPRDGRWRARVARARNWREDPLVDRFRSTPLGELVASMLEINVRDRALGLAGQAFIAVVPLVIVLATWLSSQDGAAVGDWLVDRFSLSGQAADAVDQLFRQPPEQVSGVSVLGVAILLVSVNSFARLLQRTYESAWQLPSRAPRRTLQRVESLVVLVLLLVALTWLTAGVRRLPVGSVLAVPVQLAVAVPCWCLIARKLVSGRVTWSMLVPGAVISAVVQVVATWAGAIWMPILIERNAGRYGVIGVAVALICWLVVLAFLLVACTVVGAWAARLREGRRGRFRSGRSVAPR